MPILKIHYDGKINIDIEYEMSNEYSGSQLDKTSKEKSKKDLQDIIDRHMSELREELLDGAVCANDSASVVATGKRFTMKYEESANGNTEHEAEC